MNDSQQIFSDVCNFAGQEGMNRMQGILYAALDNGGQQSALATLETLSRLLGVGASATKFLSTGTSDFEKPEDSDERVQEIAGYALLAAFLIEHKIMQTLNGEGCDFFEAMQKADELFRQRTGKEPPGGGFSAFLQKTREEAKAKGVDVDEERKRCHEKYGVVKV